MSAPVQPIADPWLRFAFEAERLNAPVYAAIARDVHGDAEIRALAAHAQLHQPHPNLLFGAVHYLLLRGEARGEIAQYYRTLGNSRAIDARMYPAFREFCLTHADALAPIIASRVTNTNEVGRSSLLHPGFLELARGAGEPLHLIEIGPSAGINMFWDRFGYSYIRGAETFASGAPDAEVILECELRGSHLPPFGPSPIVATRVGLERNPVDRSNPANRDWLRALVWSDHLPRLQRLEQALAATADTKPDIRAGNALSLLHDALAAMPAGGTVGIYHTIVTYQFSDDERAALDDLLVIAGLRRPVWRLSFEATPGLVFPLALTCYADGTKTTHELAHCNAHGAWLEWLK